MFVCTFAGTGAGMGLGMGLGMLGACTSAGTGVGIGLLPNRNCTTLGANRNPWVLIGRKDNLIDLIHQGSSFSFGQSKLNKEVFDCLRC